MAIGLLTLELYLPGVDSLKSKRRIIKSLRDRIGNKYNVSVAEMELQDKWQRGMPGIVSINSSKVHVEKVLNGIIGFVEGSLPGRITDQQIEFI